MVLPVAAASETPPSPPNPNEPAARPEGLPDAYWDAEKNTLKVDPAALVKDLKQRDELLAFKSADDSRKLTLPDAPDKYEIKLPEGFKPPEGITFEFKTDDPLLARARELAHTKGVDQETFSEFLGLYAGAQIQDQATVTAAKADQIAKLGVNGPARVDAVTNWMKARIGEADAGVMSTMLVTAAHVAAFEKLMRQSSSQGAGSFSQQHRQEQDTKPSNEEYDKWSFAEKREYSQTGKRPQRAA